MSFNDDLAQEREQVLRLIRHASAGWAEAMRAHKLAPPDNGFADRLKRLADAAAAEQVAWEQANAAGLMWRPVPGAERAEPPYELRPGTGRRGPEELWIRFDLAVTELNQAIAGSSSTTVASAFGAMADTAGALADAVRREDEYLADVQSRTAARARERNVA